MIITRGDNKGGKKYKSEMFHKQVPWLMVVSNLIQNKRLEKIKAQN